MYNLALDVAHLSGNIAKNPYKCYNIGNEGRKEDVTKMLQS